MSDYVISEEQLQTFDVATLAEDEYIDSEIFAEIRSHPLSEELKAERGRVLDAVLKIKDHTDFHFTSDRIKFEREIESLRSSD